MNKEVPLEPCPFCGGEAVVYNSGPDEWEGRCVGECKTYYGTAYCSEKTMREVWNRRAPAQPAHSQEGEPSIIKALRITAPGSKWMDVINYIDALLAQPREAKKELRFATKARDQYLEHCGHLTQRAEKAEAALQAARDDAERYRWLRDACLGSKPVIVITYYTTQGYERVTELDELVSVIDTARSLKTKARPESGKE